MIYLLLYFTLLVHYVYPKPQFIANNFLYEYQFLDTLDPDPVVLKAAIKRFQKVTGLTESGIVDLDTLIKITAPRCGRPSNVPQFTVVHESKWKKNNLTYYINNNPKSLSLSKISDTLKDAVAAWTKNVNLQLTETTSELADIQIHFTEQDGPRNNLGYAYFPENGEIYFDKDEFWTTSLLSANSDENIYFGWVAAHELGHALGLHHTETMQSVMFPYYSTVVTNPADSDIKKLKSLYGQTSLNNSDLCNGNTIDGIVGDKELLFITGEKYFIFSNGVVESGPYSLEALFPNFPKKIDAAFNVGTANFFFSNNIYYKYKHKGKNYTKKLISAGFNVPSNLDAAFYHPEKSTVYIFKGSKYYAINIKLKPNKRLIVNGKNISNDWEGIPDNIQAAALFPNSKALFIKDTTCYRVDLNLKKLLETVDCLSTIYQC